MVTSTSSNDGLAACQLTPTLTEGSQQNVRDALAIGEFYHLHHPKDEHGNANPFIVIFRSG